MPMRSILKAYFKDKIAFESYIFPHKGVNIWNNLLAGKIKATAILLLRQLLNNNM